MSCFRIAFIQMFSHYFAAMISGNMQYTLTSTTDKEEVLMNMQQTASMWWQKIACLEQFPKSSNISSSERQSKMSSKVCSKCETFHLFSRQFIGKFIDNTH